MEKKMSLRLRMTIITTVIFIVVGIIFTVFSVVNLNYSLILPIQESMGENITDESGTLINADLGKANEDIQISVSSIIKEFDNKMQTYIYVGIAFMLFTIMVGVFVMYKVSGAIIKPVCQLKEEITSLDKNELSYRITDFDAGDELNQLADAFNIMLERLENSFSRENRFISDAAHEIKTPLAVIKTNIDVLELDEHPSEEEVKKSMDVIRKQTDRLTTLMDALLNMATETDYQIDKDVWVDELVREIILELDAQSKERQIHIFTELEHVKVKANTTMLKHAILNIIENAIKYNKEAGTIEIHVYAKDEKCYICVRDTGPGIDEEHLKHIYEPFYRVDKSRSRSMGGSGLGLAISQEIIHRHRGYIKYEKNEPHGSIFTVVLENL